MNQSKIKCNQCGHTSTKHLDQKEHLRQLHYQCPNCKETLNDYLSEHISSRSKSKDLINRSWYNDMYGDFDGYQIPF
ncbi:MULTISPECIES: hypothetical protein [Methanobacterium]|jgi:transposase-like protein|uniref:C2H2-type domain-containing protein n=1 Tax=Methanobacterium bryantii TaxID=2161 RepID=A0A2A2H8G3_METBR|nr:MULTISPECIES: hypothetical protein [Methanobacterium]OEC87874.1 hypothetical protein A9507_06780 [Methanobacterium sp. A39]PAV05741.1 hypothetical protein ASJ80_08390 [Methanobacterium bryantii]